MGEALHGFAPLNMARRQNEDVGRRVESDPAANIPDPVWGSGAWNATNDPQHAKDVAYLHSSAFANDINRNNPGMMGEGYYSEYDPSSNSVGSHFLGENNSNWVNFYRPAAEFYGPAIGGAYLGSLGAGETGAAGDVAGSAFPDDPSFYDAAPVDAGPLTQYAQAPGSMSDVTPSDVNNADLSNINNPGAPSPDPVSSPLQASQDPLGSAGDPGPSVRSPSLQDEQARYYKNMNDANAARNAPGTTVGDFFKGMGNDPLGTLGNMSLGSGALSAATLVNMIGSYRARKQQQQQQAAAIQAQQTRQNQINANPNTGGANPIPNSRTQYLGTPNFNPFISQGPQDRLAFGPSPWQLGAPGQPSPGGQARGGLAGMNMRDPAQGALSLARGPGGGQDDKIPALLSDGEYVMDAGAVADLGDGSTKEGARRLDTLRQNLRMHKRSAPAASIPPKAKSPASYLRSKA